MNNKGFTLVELIAVIAILGILVIITTPTYDTINKSMKEKNYASKTNSIEKNVLNYAEKYLKDKIYDGTNHCHYFSVDYLIKNGIVASDSETEEYIKNDVTGETYKGNYYYVLVYYDNNSLKLRASASNSANANSTNKNFNLSGVTCNSSVSL